MISFANIINGLFTVKYIIKLGLNEGYFNPFKKLSSPKLNPAYILANGPSLKDFLSETDNDPQKYANVDFFVVNDFAVGDYFSKLKPRYYTLSDPLFFVETIYSERGRNTIKALAEKVFWDMTLFIPINFNNSEFLNPIYDNNNITIVPYHRIEYRGTEKFRNWFYRHGLGNGEFSTVALNALYAALMCGYKKIYLYGIDHTFFNNIVVSDKNELCYKESHFYGEDASLRPMLNHHVGIVDPIPTFKMSEFLQEKLRIFTGHEIMNRFANSIGAEIINCTPESMVDAYKRHKS